jgi:hypothetical protein
MSLPVGDPAGWLRKERFMRIRALLFMPVLAAAVLGVGAGSASAATLWTTPAHTSRVAVGQLASVAAFTNVRLTSGTSGSTVENCDQSTLSLNLVQNNDAAVIGAIGGGSFTGCAPFATVTPTFSDPSGTSTPWTLTVTGNSTTSGTRTQWRATVDSVNVDFGGGNYRGTLGHASGGNITAWQPTATGAPICLEFNSSGSLIGPLTGDGRIDATYCFEGSKASQFSLTN